MTDAEHTSPVPRGGAFSGDWRLDAGACALVVVATLAVFWPLFGYGFVDFDDGTYVFENARVIRGLDASNAAWAFTPQYGHWHPLTWLTLMLESELFGVSPAVHHTSSLLMHVATACLLYLALAKLTMQRGASVVVALLFAVHPLHVEPVVWISSRKDVLSGVFFAATLLAYARFARRERFGHIGVVAAALALGLMSKAMLVTVPFVLLLLDVWPLQRIDWDDLRGSLTRLVREKAALFVLVVMAVVLAIQAAEAHGMVRSEPLIRRGIKTLLSYAFYIEKTFVPADLSVTYPTFPLPVGLGVLLAIFAGLAAVTAGAFAWRRQRPWLAVGWLWYLGMMVPVIGIVPVAGHDVADRYAYLPIVGLFIIVVWGVVEWVGPRPRLQWPARALAAGAIISSMALSFMQLAHWETTERLFAHAIAVTPDNWVAHRALAGSLGKSGETKRAIAEYEIALEINPHDWKSTANLAQLHARDGRHDRAIVYYRRAIEVGSSRPELSTPEQRAAHGFAAIHFELASSLMEAGRRSEAISERSEAIRLDPRYREQRFPRSTR